MLNNKNRKQIIVAGGGTAGWMTAAALSKLLGHYLDVTLVESDDIGTVGVGEATIPTMQSFHRLIGVDEQKFLRETQGTFKLGINFENWRDIGKHYFHSFGDTGKPSWAGEFQHFWLRGLKEGIDAPFGDYCPELKAALAGKFAIVKKPRVNYAYHLDATLYARYLRRLSEQRGVKRVEGKIKNVELNSSTGYIEALHLESGEVIKGELFVDCTGFRGLLIEDALKTGYENWSKWLICDSAVALQTRLDSPPSPYTHSIAYASGWRWRIPLQHRMGNGLVYSSAHMVDEEASRLLQQDADGEPLKNPRLIRFRPGRRLKTWNKNCIAIGLSSGFIEPLESTSIHLISSTIFRLLRLIPLDDINSLEVDEFNRQSLAELENIRDFIILHYKVTDRTDSEFWRYCKNMSVPDSLARRLALYESSARIFCSADELFTVNSWNQVMLGQGLMPKGYHPVADIMPAQELTDYLRKYRESILQFVQQLPPHGDFVRQYCEAPE